MDELELLIEVPELLNGGQDVPVCHRGGDGLEGIGIPCQEGTGLLLRLRRLRKLEGQAGAGDLISTRYGHGDLIGIAEAAVNGDREGRGIEPALAGDLHDDGKGVGGRPLYGQAAAAAALVCHLAGASRRAGGNPGCEQPVRTD